MWKLGSKTDMFFLSLVLYPYVFSAHQPAWRDYGHDRERQLTGFSLGFDTYTNRTNQIVQVYALPAAKPLQAMLQQHRVTKGCPRPTTASYPTFMARRYKIWLALSFSTFTLRAAPPYSDIWQIGFHFSPIRTSPCWDEQVMWKNTFHLLKSKHKYSLQPFPRSQEGCM